MTNLVGELLPSNEVALGGPRGMRVTRTLPGRQRRMVGAWCFLDAYGPEDLSQRPGMRVPPHPHTGLQTVSWLIAGEIEHRDSLGSVRLVRPGQLSLMTAGRGIAHSEETPVEHSPVLHGVQLWVAMPASARDGVPTFEHHASLPALESAGARVTVIVGSLDGAASPARTYTPLFGADIALDTGAASTVPLRGDFEYAALAMSGGADVDGVALGPGPLLYLGAGRTSLTIAAPAGPARVLLLGGEPFEEQIVMWWNFVGRDHDEIVAARSAWETGDGRFGRVDHPADPLPAPPMPTTRLVPRGRVR